MARERTRHHIGGYRVIAPIGVGASATVYRALNESSGAEVAVKVLAENFSLLPEMRQRFQEEVELLSAIDSPSVAKIYELGETSSGQPFMVLELADRGDLRHRVEGLRAEGRAPGRADLLALAEHLADALSALHRADIVHRDVSPGNVLIRTGGDAARASRAGGPLPGASPAAVVLEPGERYLLADLGFAKDLEYASGLTAGGGTKGFAAPEQRDEVTVVDHRVDVFSATAVMEWMTQGSGLVGDLEMFFDAGLATAPDRRFDSMDEWLASISAALGVHTETFQAVATAKAARLPGAAQALPPKEKRAGSVLASKRLLVGAGVPVVVGLAAMVFGLRPSRLDDGADHRVASPTAQTAISTSVSANTSTQSPTPSSAQSPASSSSPTPSSTSAPSSAPSSTSASSSASSATSASSSAPSSTAAGTPTSTPTSIPTTTTAPSTVTTRALTTTTFSSIFANSPRAYVQTPRDEAVISGDLRITGTANYRGGITGVGLVIRHIDSGRVWHDSTKSFQSTWTRFPLPVAPTNATDVTWSYTVPAEGLEPGRYLIRVWAEGTDLNDPVSNQHHVTIRG